MIEKVISGGQIGADIAGLRAALMSKILTGGHAPKGYRTSLGPRTVLKSYGLVEHESSQYVPRTRENARNSDGTIRFATNWNSPGEKATLREVKAAGKPHFDVTLTPRGRDADGDDMYDFDTIAAEAVKWIVDNNIRILNVAGNADPNIEPAVEGFMRAVLKQQEGIEPKPVEEQISFETDTVKCIGINIKDEFGNTVDVKDVKVTVLPNNAGFKVTASWWE